MKNLDLEIDPSATTYWATKSISIRLQPLSALSGMRGCIFLENILIVLRTFLRTFCNFCKLIVCINFVRLKFPILSSMLSKIFDFRFFSSPTTIQYQLGAVGTYTAFSGIWTVLFLWFTMYIHSFSITHPISKNNNLSNWRI